MSEGMDKLERERESKRERERGRGGGGGGMGNETTYIMQPFSSLYKHLCNHIIQLIDITAMYPYTMHYQLSYPLTSTSESKYCTDYSLICPSYAEL